MLRVVQDEAPYTAAAGAAFKLTVLPLRLVEAHLVPALPGCMQHRGGEGVSGYLTLNLLGAGCGRACRVDRLAGGSCCTSAPTWPGAPSPASMISNP